MPAIMEAFMQFRMWAGAAAIAIVLGVGTAMQAADSADDPFLWLEARRPSIGSNSRTRFH